MVKLQPFDHPAAQPTVFEADASQAAPAFLLRPRNYLRDRTTRYPVGTGSVVIFRSMPMNSRRVRWLSAKSSQ
jgi:hypothetical protein